MTLAEMLAKKALRRKFPVTCIRDESPFLFAMKSSQYVSLVKPCKYNQYSAGHGQERE